MSVETEMSEAAPASRPATVAPAPGDLRTASATVRSHARARALENALFKRSRGVPTYTVPEAAELLSISPEALYRLVRGEVFPAVRVGQKYSVPAAAVSDLLEHTARSGQCVDVAEWGPTWMDEHRRVGGAA